MNYWLLALLLMSNAALVFYVFRAARLSRTLTGVRKRFQEFKKAHHQEYVPLPMSEMLKELRDSPLSGLKSNAVDRRPHQGDLPNILPPVDCDFTAMKATLVKPVEFDHAARRADIENHAKRIRLWFAGKPEILAVHAQAISYLRRKSNHTTHARTLFLRLWREESDFLLEHLSSRWLLSALLTFMDHGETETQRLIGGAGIVFGDTLKISEWDRLASGLASDAPYVVPEDQAEFEPFPGIGRFSLQGGDIFRNTLTILVDLSLRDPVAGRILLTFLSRIAKTDSVFSRTDRAKMATEMALGSENTPKSRHWSLGRKPDQSPIDQN